MLFLLLFTQLFYFWRDLNENAAGLIFYVIPTIAPYIEYIKIWVENSHLIIYTNYNINAKAIFSKDLS